MPFGIIGILIVFSPYGILVLYFVYKAIKNRFRNIMTINILSFITIFFLFAIAYNSGNLLNSLSFTFYFALLFYLLNKKDAE